MIVVADASAVVDLLTGGPFADDVDRRMGAEGVDVVAPAHLDAEVLSALARMVRAGGLADGDVDRLLRRLQELPVDRLRIDEQLVSAAWGLRANVAVSDALHVAMALGFDGRVLTTDQRLARAVPDLVVDLES